MAKATVQAALGPVALKYLSPDDPDRAYAEIVLMVCVLSIVLTAPIGAILISVSEYLVQLEKLSFNPPFFSLLK